MDNNLHSLNKLKTDIKAARLISFLLPKDKRTEIKNLEKQVEEMEKSIILFNSYFTDLGWCAYDSMNTSLMNAAISKYESSGADAGEEVLLNYYKTDAREIIHWLKNKKRLMTTLRADIMQASHFFL